MDQASPPEPASAEHERVLRRGMATTVLGDDFNPAGVAQAGREGPRRIDDQLERMIHQVVTATGERSDSGNRPEFILRTGEVTLDRPLMAATHEAGEAPEGSRYDIVRSIGRGANGQVFAVYDNNLRRSVAAKFLHPDRAKQPAAYERFIREAQVAGALSHPNILPVYDIDIAAGGLPYFTMRQAEGRSLAELIDAAAIDSWFDRSGVVIQVCDAIAYAHDHGVVHQDIKPENIVLGGFGQVVLIDWGTAVTQEEIADGTAVLQGTPAYMAPEQARKKPIDQRCDVYAIGATLFHLLTGRLPTWSTDLEAFWRMKRAGTIQEPTAAERSTIPGPLLAIARKALAVDPAKRYQSVAALREDLRRYQAGLSVGAYQDSLAEVMRRIYRRHTATCRVATVGLLLFLLSLGLYAWEKSKEFSRWHVVLDEDFSSITTADLARDWQLVFLPWWRAENSSERSLEESGSIVQIRDGALHLTAAGIRHGCYNLVYRHPFPGNTRLTWEVTATALGTDLNSFIAGRDRTSGYSVHVAGWNDRSRVDCIRGVDTPSHLQLDRVYLDQPIAVGRTYHMQLSWVDGRIHFAIDGETIIDVEDYAPLIGSDNQQFGLEFSSSPLRIDRLRIERQLLPQKVPALVVADGLMAEGALVQAIQLYRGIINGIPDDDMRATAVYRIARCQIGLGQLIEAEATLRGFFGAYGHHHLRHAARLLMADLLLRQQRLEEAEAYLQAMAADGSTPAPLARIAVNRFGRFYGRALCAGDEWWVDQEAEARQLLDHWRRWERALGVSTVDLDAVQSTLRVLIRSGYAEEVAREYADQPQAAAEALFALGRPQHVLERYGHRSQLAIRAWRALGMHGTVIEKAPFSSDSLPSYLALGRGDEVLEYRYVTERERQDILLGMGHFDRLLEERPWDPWILFCAGRGDEAVVTPPSPDDGRSLNEGEEVVLLTRGEVAVVYPLVQKRWRPRNRTHHQASTLEALRLIETGDVAAAEAVLDRYAPRRAVDWLELNAYILAPALRHLSVDDHDALRDYWRNLQIDQRFAYGAVWPALARILDGTTIEHHRDIGSDWLPVLEGLGHEMAGDWDAAREAYRRVPAITRIENLVGKPFADWRLRELADR